MKDVVRLAEPEAGPLKVVADGGLDVVTHVTHEQMEFGWAKLREVMLREPSARMREWAQDGHSEDELRLLCGLFVAAFSAIPMVTSNFLDWLLFVDPDQVDNFVMWRMKQLGDEQFEYVLDGRDLTELGLERIDQPVSRGPVSVAALRRDIGRLSLEDIVELESAFSSRIEELTGRRPT